MSVNKSFLHRQNGGDKESLRRGKDLKKLFNENALGPNKSLLNKAHHGGGDSGNELGISHGGKESMEQIMQRGLDIAVGSA